MLVWDVAKAGLRGQGVTPLGSNVHMCRWSRQSRLLTCSRSSFQVWWRASPKPEQPHHWSNKIYETPRRVTAAAWSHSGDVLLVAEQNSSRVHIVNFQST